ncbi:MAG TPA: phenylalanine--tRNA ligase subunit beta, partial [Thermosynergistes sp.]|nr:phenylalanine--tRNA ligase subunit beta [Thermosynergistes sp.]
ASGLKLSFVPGEETFAHKGQSAHILCEGKRIGYLARIKPSIERELELGASVYAFEFDLSPLTREFFPRYALGDRFPPVMRDVAIIVPKGKSADSVLGDIKRLASPLVCSIRLFDVYEGQGIPEGQRSLAFSLEYRSPERTLSDEEVEEHHRNLRAALSREGYIVR